MPVRIKPVSEIKVKLGIDTNGRVQKFFTETCYKHMDKYVPFNEGILATNVDIQPTWITYEQEYASYQYYGQRRDGTHKVVNHTTTYHPLASTYWDRKMVSAEINDVVKEVQGRIGGKR